MPITAELAAAAATTITALGRPPSYARVDLVRGGDGQLLLIEVELIEPELWFDLAPRRGDRAGRRRHPGMTTATRAPSTR